MVSRDYPAEVEKVVTELQSILGAILQDLAKEQGAASKVKSRIDDIKAELKEKNERLEEAQKLKATAEAQAEELSNEAQLKSSKIERLERTITEMKEKAESATDLANKNRALQSEIDAIKTQLSKMSKTYKELVDQTEATIPVQELLALYISLLEDVFGAQPHAKTLFLLHGAKEVMSREAIVKTAGHTATAIRKALGDLARAGLVDYDVEQGTAVLKKRLYPV